MPASLLAHLIPRIAAKAEPAATEALAYVLNASPDVKREFVSIVLQTGIKPFTAGRIEPEKQHDESKPDLTIYDDKDGAIRVFVENKFWAGLADTQPVAYLKKLPEEPTSVLLFVVPRQRIDIVWSELEKRCGHDKIDLSGEETTKDITWVRAGQRTMAITSWKYVLERLRHAAKNSGNTAIEQDIVQLRGLTDQMDTAEFLPLRGDEVTDQTVARRLIDYGNLSEDITKRVEKDGNVTMRRLSGHYGYVGRSGSVNQKFEIWMGIYHEMWRLYGITPVWLEVYSEPFSSGAWRQSMQKIKNLVNDAQESPDGKKLLIPIRLTTGVERQSVIEDAVKQFHSIADTFLQAFSG